MASRHTNSAAPDAAFSRLKGFQMTTNPVTDADEYIASLFAKQEARQAAVDAMADQFRSAAVKCDANALVPWAGTVIDHEQRKALGTSWASP